MEDRKTEIFAPEKDAEIRRLKEELYTLKQELIEHSRTITAMESDFDVKMGMFSKLVEENEKHKDFLMHLMKNSVDFLVLIDNDLSVAYCSESFTRMIGVECFEDVEGLNILAIYRKLPDKSDCGLFRQLTDMLTLSVTRNKATFHDVTADISGSGTERSYRITNIPMSDDNVISGVIINWNDITDITKAKNEAEEANKAKSNFLATMSHEIRTPMNAILGITQMELQDTNLPDRNITALEKIYNSGNTLLSIINDILDMSKIESGKLELQPVEYDIPSVIHDTAQLNVVRIGSKDIQFHVHTDKNVPSKVFGDELRIRQILNNLLSNAFKYTEKGHVKLTTKHTEEEDGIVVLHLSIEDTGQGMRPEDCEKLFSEEYLRFNMNSNRTTEGTGLGLSITKSLVELMNGSITVESEYGRGSTFTVNIPQTTVPCTPIGAVVSEKLRNFVFSGKKERRSIVFEIMPYGRVLVVDDVETNLYVARGLLSPYQLHTETAISGFKAIEMLKEKTFDIVFMDHMMPLMDGIKTTKKLRELGYDGAIIALTANAIVGNDQMFIENGFDDFISKPIDVRQLNTILNKWVRDRYPDEAKKYKPKAIEATEIQSRNVTPKLLEIFCADAKKAVVTLRETVNNGDTALFTITAHAMKSALVNVGRATESEWAFTLEEAGRRADIDFIAENVNGFIEALESLIEEYTPEVAEIDDSNIDEDMLFLTEQLNLMKFACGGYNKRAACSAIDCLKKKQWKNETLKAVEEIRDIIYFESDFEKAAEKAELLLSENIHL